MMARSTNAPFTGRIQKRKTNHLHPSLSACNTRPVHTVWVKKLEAGAFDEDARAADLLQEYEAKIAALERMVGRQALEIEFLKGALKSVPRPRSASTSVFTGPTASPSPKDAA